MLSIRLLTASGASPTAPFSRTESASLIRNPSLWTIWKYINTFLAIERHKEAAQAAFFVCAALFQIWIFNKYLKYCCIFCLCYIIKLELLKRSVSMKRIFIILLALVLVLSSCSPASVEQNSGNASSESSQSESTAEPEDIYLKKIAKSRKKV